MHGRSRAPFVPRCRIAGGRVARVPERSQVSPLPLFAVAGVKTSTTEMESTPDNDMTRATIPTGHRAACRPQQDRALRLSGSPSLKWVIANTYHRTPLHVRAPGGTIHAIGCTPTLGSTLTREERQRHQVSQLGQITCAGTKPVNRLTVTKGQSEFKSCRCGRSRKLVTMLLNVAVVESR
jgi:hypothetical protein